MKIDLGVGVLTWDASERRTDRYGSVWLMEEGENSLKPGCPISLVIERKYFNGKRGEIRAYITATRESTHIGDLYHAIFPETPDVGDEFILGQGELFFDTAPHGGVHVGVKPIDGRSSQWMNMKNLYRCHEQSVQLWFIPHN